MINVHYRKIKVLLLSLSVCVLSFSHTANADFIFGEPSKVPNINTSSYDGCGSISSDGLELYIDSCHPYGADGCYSNIYLATRPSIYDDWGMPTKLEPPVNTDGPEDSPCISADGLELYFDDGWNPSLVSGCAHRPNGYGGADIWVSTRPTKDDPWGEPQNLGLEINLSAEGRGELSPMIAPDGLSLYFHSYRDGGYGLHDLYVAKRSTKDDVWGPPENLGPFFNTNVSEGYVFIAPDNLTLYFSRSRYSVVDYDIYVSRRASVTDSWEAPVLFEPVNSSMSEYNLRFAQDGSILYFNRIAAHASVETLATVDIWQVEVTPNVDLNSDGLVDAKDICIMVDHWHRKSTLCDIAPAPLGDGFVDIQDLTVLAEHLFEEIPRAQ